MMNFLHIPLYILPLFIVPVIFRLFQRLAPVAAPEMEPDNGRRMPWGVPDAMALLIGATIAVGGYYLLYAMNHLWALRDHGALMQTYRPVVIWMVAPGLTGLCSCYLILFWIMHRMGYGGQAAETIAQNNARGRFDVVRVMKWLFYGLCLPVLLATCLALPMHMSVMQDEIRVTSYGHIGPSIYKFADVRHAYIIRGYRQRDGSIDSAPDLVLVYADDRHLHANVEGDGGTSPSPQLVHLLLGRTHLYPWIVDTEGDIPKQQP